MLCHTKYDKHRSRAEQADSLPCSHHKDFLLLDEATKLGGAFSRGAGAMLLFHLHTFPGDYYEGECQCVFTMH